VGHMRPGGRFRARTAGFGAGGGAHRLFTAGGRPAPVGDGPAPVDRRPPPTGSAPAAPQRPRRWSGASPRAGRLLEPQRLPLVVVARAAPALEVAEIAIHSGAPGVNTPLASLVSAAPNDRPNTPIHHLFKSMESRQTTAASGGQRRQPPTPAPVSEPSPRSVGEDRIQRSIHHLFNYNVSGECDRIRWPRQVVAGVDPAEDRKG